MLKNRSVPADVVLPHLTYENVDDALSWPTKAFGFIEHYHYGERGGRIKGAQMHLGDGWIMIDNARPGRASPAQVGHQTQSLTAFVDDVDAHFDRAKSAGAGIVEEYGERQYGAGDVEGHHWLFSRHARDVSPDEWGDDRSSPLSRQEIYLVAQSASQTLAAAGSRNGVVGDHSRKSRSRQLAA
jgi:uncharacterized glyoxalase superfamily protein PhnB